MKKESWKERIKKAPKKNLILGVFCILASIGTFIYFFSLIL